MNQRELTPQAEVRRLAERVRHGPAAGTMSSRPA